MAKKKRGRPAQSPVRAMSRQLLDDLDEVESLLAEKRWNEARAILADLHQRFPTNKGVLTLLVNLAYDQHDMELYQSAAGQLLRLTPNDADLTRGLAGAYMVNMRPALGLRTAQQFLDRWPDHPHAAEVREMVAKIEPLLVTELPKLGLDGPDALEVAAQHEEVQSLLSQGHWEQARLLAQQVLRRTPDLIPVLNNLSQIYSFEGQTDDAIATAERVLALDDDNHHALSNLTHYFVASGRAEDAWRMAERLKAVVSEAPDLWTKIAEALSYLGDDEGVLDTLRRAEGTRVRQATGTMALLYHLAAVAALRLGKEADARKHWRQALKDSAWMQVAQANLDDLRAPIGERHAPWPFALQQWVPRKTLDAYVKLVDPASRRGDGAVTVAHRRFLQRHAEMIPLIPLLLDRGDPAGREFALRVALSSDLPAIQEAVRDFALSQRGPDTMRLQAAQAAREAGLLPVGTVRLWSAGEWRDLQLLGWEIYDEPDSDHLPEVEKRQREATQALRDGDAERGERILKRALEIEPDAPDLWNNLAAAYSQQGRVREAEEIIQRVHERNPDYFFGRTNVALINIRNRRLDEAEEMLKPLVARSRLHTSEFDALMNAEIELYTVRKNPEAARTWLNMWLSTDPEHPTAMMWQQRLGGGQRRR
jgi:tetratricopeptide (TPR) repeat protein